MKKVLSLSMAFLFLLQSGCASIVGGKYETVHIETTPAGANVRTERDDKQGISPTDISLKRKNEHEIIIEKEGFKTKRIVVDTDLRGWFWMNLLSWGLIGMVVDLATGSAYNLDPKNITVNLEKA